MDLRLTLLTTLLALGACGSPRKAIESHNGAPTVITATLDYANSKLVAGKDYVRVELTGRPADGSAFAAAQSYDAVAGITEKTGDTTSTLSLAPGKYAFNLSYYAADNHLVASAFEQGHPDCPFVTVDIEPNAPNRIKVPVCIDAGGGGITPTTTDKASVKITPVLVTPTLPVDLGVASPTLTKAGDGSYALALNSLKATKQDDYKCKITVKWFTVAGAGQALSSDDASDGADIVLSTAPGQNLVLTLKAARIMAANDVLDSAQVYKQCGSDQSPAALINVKFSGN